MIMAKATTYVGVQFSRLCEIKYDENNEPYDVKFKYSELKSKVEVSFEDREIHPSEVTPELISLILNLDYEQIQDSHDAVIGLEIRDIDIGTKNVSFCYPSDLEIEKNKVREELKDIVGDDLINLVMIFLIGSIHTPTELTKNDE